MTISKVDRAILEISALYAGQRRDDGETPGIVHPIGVLRNLTALAGAWQEDLKCAAVLHDVIEDFGYGEELLKMLFGADVLRIVKELTLPPGLDHARKTLHLVRLMEEGSSEAVLIKLCDRLDNVSDMSGWKPARRARYLQQTRSMLTAVEERDDWGNGPIEFIKFKLWQVVNSALRDEPLFLNMPEPSLVGESSRKTGE